MKAFISFFCFCMALFFVPIHAETNDAHRFIVITGIVKDHSTKRILPYVNISVKNYDKGTITNNEGKFTLKVDKDLPDAQLVISHIGYKNLTLPLPKEEGETQTYWLTPTTRQLKEIVVRGGNPRELVETAIEKIPQNYSNTTQHLTGFYRETVKKRNHYINIAEAVIDIQKTAYTEDASHDRVRIMKGRHLVSPKRGDTLAVKLLGGPTNAIYLDVVKNPDLLLDKEMLDFYEYTMENVEFIDERPQFVIRFSPTRQFPQALYQGRFYIDQERLSFTKAEFHLDLTDKQKAISAILHRKPFGLRFRPLEVSYLIHYIDRGDKTDLHYMRSEIQFKCDWKRKLFATNYTILSEMVVTDRYVSTEKIPRRMEFERYQVFSDNASHFFDADFWEDYNIIEPDEPLEKAVNKLKKQYSER